MDNSHDSNEPVAWVERDGELVWNNREAAIGRNLYISSQPSKPWVGLTTDEMIQVKDRFKLSGVNIAVAFRTIEAKLKEKNT